MSMCRCGGACDDLPHHTNDRTWANVARSVEGPGCDQGETPGSHPGWMLQPMRMRPKVGLVERRDHPAGRDQLVDRRAVGVVERHVERAEIVLQLLHRTRADDRTR